MDMDKKQITDEEHEKITEVEKLPKDDAEYMERLFKKDIFVMNLEELKDYLDAIIQGRINTENNPALVDIFSCIQLYFRIVDLQTDLINARANSAHSYVIAISLFLKQMFPDSYKDIIACAEEINKEKDMGTVDGLPIKVQESIMKKAKLLYRQDKVAKVD